MVSIKPHEAHLEQVGRSSSHSLRQQHSSFSPSWDSWFPLHFSSLVLSTYVKFHMLLKLNKFDLPSVNDTIQELTVSGTRIHPHFLLQWWFDLKFHNSNNLYNIYILKVWFSHYFTYPKWFDLIFHNSNNLYIFSKKYDLYIISPTTEHIGEVTLQVKQRWHVLIQHFHARSHTTFVC